MAEPPAGAPALPRLSCITTSLIGYLRQDFPHIDTRMAGDVRLAVRTDGPVPAFSHHRVTLARLPHAHSLGYAGTDDEAQALDALAAELDRHGRLLVVADAGAQPWTPGYGRTRAAHWLLVDDRDASGWHVRDAFEALLPDGPQQSFQGRLDDAELVAALRQRGDRTAAQLLREQYAFGFPEESAPASPLRWLTRRPRPVRPQELPGRWLHGLEALAWLGDWFGSRAAEAADSYEDLWAAARHHEHRFGVLAATGRLDADVAAEAGELWWQLVRALRFGLESARRGRPRSSLIAHTFASTVRRLDELGVDDRPLERR
jgi:hypothetical protein